MENIRFFNEEEANDDAFSKKLASICDIYINDAFSCSHREQASIHKIAKYSNQHTGLSPQLDQIIRSFCSER